MDAANMWDKEQLRTFLSSALAEREELMKQVEELDGVVAFCRRRLGEDSGGGMVLNNGVVAEPAKPKQEPHDIQSGSLPPSTSNGLPNFPRTLDLASLSIDAIREAERFMHFSDLYSIIEHHGLNISKQTLRNKINDLIDAGRIVRIRFGGSANRIYYGFREFLRRNQEIGGMDLRDESVIPVQERFKKLNQGDLELTVKGEFFPALDVHLAEA